MYKNIRIGISGRGSGTVHICTVIKFDHEMLRGEDRSREMPETRRRVGPKRRRIEGRGQQRKWNKDQRPRKIRVQYIESPINIVSELMRICQSCCWSHRPIIGSFLNYSLGPTATSQSETKRCKIVWGLSPSIN